MDFGLTEEQGLLVETVTRYLEEHCPLDKVRVAAEQPAEVANALSAGLRELGIM